MIIQSKLHSAGRMLLGAFVLSAASVYFYNAQAAGTQPQIPRGVALKSWHENGSGGQYLLQVIQGKPLKAGKTITGTVTGDFNCDADAEGLSHCHNTVDLADGGKITVVNSHEMHRNRCLGGGDKIVLKGVGGSWIMGTLAGR
jgi:hypothetical protein